MTDEELIATDMNKCIMDLTKIEKPFALLTPEEQAALQAWPHGWERVNFGGAWVTIDRPDWYLEYTYRAKPAPKRIVQVAVEQECNHPWCGDKCGTDTLTAEQDMLKSAQIDAIRAALEAAAEVCAGIRQKISNGPMPEGARFDYEQAISAIDPAAIAAKLKGGNHD